MRASFPAGKLNGLPNIFLQQWNSRCRENYIWTYGKVLKDDGKIGWSVIAIRGSCSCGVSRKSHRGGNYFDEFVE